MLTMLRTVILSLILSLSSADRVCAQDVQLTPERIGPIHVRMSGAEIRSLGMDVVEDVVNLEGDDYVRFQVGIADDISVEVIFWGGRAVDLTTDAASFMTDRGAHVGMTLEELRRLYPEGQIFIGNEEGFYFSFQTTPDGAVFLFDTRTIPESCFAWRGECPDLSDRRAYRYFVRDLDRQP